MFRLSLVNRFSNQLMVSTRRPIARRLCTPAEKSTTSNLNISATHKPNELEKKFLVWTKKYKSVDEVPPMVNQEVMERARNRIRIKLANILMVLTFLGCVLMIVTGKKAAESGDTVQKRNLEWHKQYNAKASTEEDYAKKFENIAAAGNEARK